jgi:hypothetical protein
LALSGHRLLRSNSAAHVAASISYCVAFCDAQAKRQSSTNVYETALDFRTYCIVRKTH